MHPVRNLCAKMPPYANHKILSRLQTTKEEFKRINTPIKKDAKYLFFPGCNVYQQSEKILNTLDILDSTGCDYSYLPGLENCCDDRCYYTGDTDNGISLTNNFIKTVNEYNPEVLLVWCPTCHCRFSHYLNGNEMKHIKIMSVHEYILDNMDTLQFNDSGQRVQMTLHEACKSNYQFFYYSTFAVKFDI